MFLCTLKRNIERFAPTFPYTFFNIKRRRRQTLTHTRVYKVTFAEDPSSIYEFIVKRVGVYFEGIATLYHRLYGAQSCNNKCVCGFYTRLYGGGYGILSKIVIYARKLLAANSESDGELSTNALYRFCSESIKSYPIGWK